MVQQARGHGDEGQVLAVVGGGAAGIFGAIRAKECRPDLHVIVLEKAAPLSKVRISGGGRCNVTTGLFVDPMPLAGQYPRGHKELRGAFFRTHGPADTAAWFQQRGVALKTEADGRMFPKSDTSATIIECLLSQARSLGVVLRTGCPVARVSAAASGGFDVHLGGARDETRPPLRADFVLLATGSSPLGYKMAGALGHSIVEARPSLFTFRVPDDPALTALAGVSFREVRATLEVADMKAKDAHLTQVGPLLITHWGLSGPLVLRLSAWAARHLFASQYEGALHVDFKKQMGGPPPAGVELPRRFWHYLLARQLWASASKKTLLELAATLKRCTFRIHGKGEFKDEFVTAGGVPLKEIDMRRMESKLHPGLFFAGEIVDIDGVTGGFNFQNAWTGGYIAGSSLAARAGVSA
eukprot:jgi/Mesen1/8986/ME000056S08395